MQNNLFHEKKWMLLRSIGLTVALIVGSSFQADAAERLMVSLERDFVAPDSTYEMPDVTPFTVEAIRSKLPTEWSGTVSIVPTEGEPLLSEALRRERGEDLQRRQGQASTQTIAIEAGAVTLSRLVESLGDSDVAVNEEGTVTLRMPILIRPGATLVINGKSTPTVRLSTDRGVFVANGGTLFVVGAEVVGWDEAAEKPSTFVDKKNFRPYLSSYVRSTTYFADSRFAHLGFNGTTAYGISLTTQPERVHGEPTDDAPTGQIVGCTFEGLYYGFYSYEARDVAIVGNTYTDSIVYGIDPHDRSTRLLIVGNTTTGTREKHGIIGSRGVSDSWIVDNVSHGNNGSGVMLDRQCHGNVIAKNRVYNNGQGIAIYESSDNLLIENLIVGHKGSAIRMRNSSDLRVVDNTLVRSGDFAVEVSAKRLDDHDARIERGDTYTEEADVSLIDNRFFENRGLAEASGLGQLLIDGLTTTVDLAAVEERLEAPISPASRIGEPRNFGGDLKPIRALLTPLFSSDPVAVRISGSSASKMFP